jgi:hypothetical protein
LTHYLHIDIVATSKQTTEQDEMNIQATAKALIEMTEEMKTVKRNKSGSINSTSETAIRRRAVAKIMEAGEDRATAYDMVNNHSKNFK